MSINLFDLYRIQKKDVKKAGQILASAFYEDSAWINVMPDEEVRKKKLPITFEFILTHNHYIRQFCSMIYHSKYQYS